jgi:hypothetical protein
LTRYPAKALAGQLRLLARCLGKYRFGVCQMSGAYVAGFGLALSSDNPGLYPGAFVKELSDVN